MSEFDAGYELTAFLVGFLRQNADLHDLLFRDRAPINEFDVRIYESDADLAEAQVANVLPRVLVAVQLDYATWEQSNFSDGPATIWVHHFAAGDQSVLVQKMSKASTDALAELDGGSTGQPSPRIMLGPLTKAGPQIKDRQPAFDEARRITDTYATRLVGVLV